MIAIRHLKLFRLYFLLLFSNIFFFLSFRYYFIECFQCEIGEWDLTPGFENSKKKNSKSIITGLNRFETLLPMIKYSAYQSNYYFMIFDSSSANL